MKISRRKRPLNRKIRHYRDTKLIIIATEGKHTEKQYFEIFRNPRIQVVIIENIDNKSAPRHVLNRLDEFSSEYDLNPDDELWLMFDVDRWNKKMLAEITRLALQKNYKLAVSNPCFEVWLFMHFGFPPATISTCQQVIDLIKEKLGSYNKSHLETSTYKDKVDEAITRAESIDQNQDDRWPQNIGTHVYKVVKNIYV